MEHFAPTFIWCRRPWLKLLNVRRSSAALVLTGSKPVPICNRFHVRRAQSR